MNGTTEKAAQTRGTHARCGGRNNPTTQKKPSIMKAAPNRSMASEILGNQLRNNSRFQITANPIKSIRWGSEKSLRLDDKVTGLVREPTRDKVTPQVRYTTRASSAGSWRSWTTRFTIWSTILFVAREAILGMDRKRRQFLKWVGWEREIISVWVCVCVGEREREREREPPSVSKPQL